MSATLPCITEIKPTNYQDVATSLHKLADRIAAGEMGHTLGVAVVIDNSTRNTVFALGRIAGTNALVGMLQSSIVELVMNAFL